MSPRWPTGEKRLSEVSGADAKAGDSGRGRSTEKTPQSKRCVVKVGIIPQGQIHEVFSGIAAVAGAGPYGWVD